MSKKYDNNLNEIKETRTFATNTTIDSKDLGTLGVYFEREMANKKIEELKQQLAEKNKEMQEWKDGTMIVKYEQQLAEKDKEIERLRKEFSSRLRLIRHPICEEIRRFIRQPENSIFYDVSLYVETAGLEKLLDKLEKGE